MMMFKKLVGTEIGGSAVGIESERYDFEGFLWILSFSERKDPIKLRHPAQGGPFQARNRGF